MCHSSSASLANISRSRASSDVALVCGALSGDEDDVNDDERAAGDRDSEDETEEEDDDDDDDEEEEEDAGEPASSISWIARSPVDGAYGLLGALAAVPSPPWPSGLSSGSFRSFATRILCTSRNSGRTS